MSTPAAVDALAARMAASQIERDFNALAVEAQRLADEAARFAAGLVRRGLVAGDASRLAQGSLQMAMQAARLDALRETAAYLAPSASRAAAAVPVPGDGAT